MSTCALQADASRILQMVKCDCGLDHNRHSVEEVRQQDWEESIKVSIRVSGSGESISLLVAWLDCMRRCLGGLKRPG